MKRAELMLAHEDPAVRGRIPFMADAMLGRGFERFEEIMWDELLNDPEEDAFGLAYKVLSEYVRYRRGFREPFLEGSYRYSDVYRSRDQLLHILKLGRVRVRGESE